MFGAFVVLGVGAWLLASCSDDATTTTSDANDDTSADGAVTGDDAGDTQDVNVLTAPTHLLTWDYYGPPLRVSRLAACVRLCMAGDNYGTGPLLVGDSALGIDNRLFVIASFLLTYDLSHSMLAEGFTTPSNSRVEPESQLVPLAPRLPTPADYSRTLYSRVAGRSTTARWLRARPLHPPTFRR